MPISAIGELSEEHWEDVKSIIFEASESAGFVPRLVSEDRVPGFIHQRIFQSLVLNEMVVCDVSSTNPNVMLELGIRLTFDRPTIIIADDQTKFQFDIHPIKHLVYPRNLKHAQVVKFTKNLEEAILATKKAEEEGNYSPFLTAMGTYQVPKLKKEEVSGTEYLVSKVGEIQLLIDRIAQSLRGGYRTIMTIPEKDLSIVYYFHLSNHGGIEPHLIGGTLISSAWYKWVGYNLLPNGVFEIMVTPLDESVSEETVVRKVKGAFGNAKITFRRTEKPQTIENH